MDYWEELFFYLRMLLRVTISVAGKGSMLISSFCILLGLLNALYWGPTDMEPGARARWEGAMEDSEKGKATGQSGCEMHF
jgi:hypothetical protein